MSRVGCDVHWQPFTLSAPYDRRVMRRSHVPRPKEKCATATNKKGAKEENRAPLPHADGDCSPRPGNRLAITSLTTPPGTLNLTAVYILLYYDTPPTPCRVDTINLGMVSRHPPTATYTVLRQRQGYNTRYLPAPVPSCPPCPPPPVPYCRTPHVWLLAREPPRFRPPDGREGTLLTLWTISPSGTC